MSAPKRRVQGAAALEWLVAAPILLLVGLSTLQVGLLMHARLGLEHALREAARAASTRHGLDAAVADGLARGLRAFWREPDAAAARARVEAGRANGSLVWRRIGPDPRVFDDFAEPARDAEGRSIAGVLEVPNDNLAFRSQAPGRVSGLTLAQANRLSLELTFAVPLQVPLVGAFMARVAARASGCIADADWRVGVTRIDLPPPEAGGLPCTFYRSADPQDPVPWRWPVVLRSSVMMHSALRPDGSPVATPGIQPAGRTVDGSGGVDARPSVPASTPGAVVLENARGSAASSAHAPATQASTPRRDARLTADGPGGEGGVSQEGECNG